MSGFDWYLILVSIFEGAVMLLLPHYSPRRFFFAITVAPDFRSSDAARRSLRRYHLCVILSVIASAALAPLHWPPVLPFLVGFPAFLAERSAVRRHAVSLPPVREAALSPGDTELPAWTPIAILSFAPPLAAATYLRAHWDRIPARFPVHWGPTGTPDRWVDKTPFNVYGLLLFESAVMLVLLALAVAIFYGSRRGPQRVAILKLLIGIMYMLGLVFTGTSLLPVVAIPFWVLLVPVPILVLAALVWAFRVVRDLPGEATPDRNWHLGAFYYNPDDAAIFVQKRVGFGYTFNFGNRLSWVLLGSLIAVFGGLIFAIPK